MFAGSGTSLIHQEMGLDYFGCDLDKDYVEFMKTRLGKIEKPLEIWENLFDFENKNDIYLWVEK